MRLRESVHVATQIFSDISIPSGAIKRAIFLAFSRPLSKFQFLLVRLRAFVLASDGKTIVEFQFLLVRLRVPYFNVESAVITYFNSFWCD